MLGELGSGGTEVWGKGWSAAPATSPPAAGLTWTTDKLLTPNDRNFPAGGLSTGPNLPERDLEALLTGVYGSSPGCLCTFDNEVKDGERVAQIATTIARPDRGYGGTYNYFGRSCGCGSRALRVTAVCAACLCCMAWLRTPPPPLLPSSFPP